MKALVMFHDSEGHPLDFILKKGFRHCFVCVQAGAYWIEFNLAHNVPTVKVMTGADFDMKSFYINQGYIVVSTSQRVMRPSRLNPFYGTLMVSNCVGLVKSLLCIDTFSWTPYSLYKELTK